MKINSIQSQHPSFGKIIYGESLKKVLKKESPSKNFLYELDKIEISLGVLGVDSKKNVDVILNHSFEEGFFGVISPKKSGTLMNHDTKCRISTDYGDIITFTNWVNEWDDICSRGVSEVLSKPIESLKKMVKK